MATAERPSKALQVGGLSTLKGIIASGSKPADSLAAKSSFQQPFHVAYDELQKQRDLQFIKDLFLEVDTDGSGYIDFEEFKACMNHPNTFRIFNQRFGLQKHQTALVFSAFDVDGDNSVSLKEFLETCTFLMQVVKDGQVISNWRQKEMRSLKESWPSKPKGLINQPNHVKECGHIEQRASVPNLATAVMAPARGGVGATGGVRPHSSLGTSRSCTSFYARAVAQAAGAR